MSITALIAASTMTVGVHLASLHAPARDSQNNTNPGLYVRTESGVVAGAYTNTHNRTSIYLGQQFKVGPLDVGIGAVSGYQRRCGPSFCNGFSRGFLTPMVVPSYALPLSVMGATPRIWYMPSAGKTSQVIHFSVEWSLK